MILRKVIIKFVNVSDYIYIVKLYKKRKTIVKDITFLRKIMNKIIFSVSILLIILNNVLFTDSTCRKPISCYYTKNVDATDDNAILLNSEPAQKVEDCCEVCVNKYDCTIFVFVRSECYYFFGPSWSSILIEQNGDEDVGSPYPL
jgi:hypothetical protein